MKKVLLILPLLIGLTSCKIYKKVDDYKHDISPLYEYEFLKKTEIDGRQGVASFEGGYIVSGSKTLIKYDKEWNVILQNDDPFANFTLSVNHISDIDIYNNEIYCGVENFYGVVSYNIQMVVYDLETLEFKRFIPFESSSGQDEFSSLTINKEENIIVTTDWGTSMNAKYLYIYSLSEEEYIKKVFIKNAPYKIQGIKYYEGHYYISCEDSTYSVNQLDNIYRVDINNDEATCVIEQGFDINGEIEGLTYTEDHKLVFIYNKTTNFKEVSRVYEYSFKLIED